MNHPSSPSLRLTALAVLVFAAATAHAGDTTPAEQLSRWSAQAGAPGSAPKGQAFFNQRHGGIAHIGDRLRATPVRPAGQGQAVGSGLPAAGGNQIELGHRRIQCGCCRHGVKRVATALFTNLNHQFITDCIGERTFNSDQQLTAAQGWHLVAAGGIDREQACLAAHQAGG